MVHHESVKVTVNRLSICQPLLAARVAMLVLTALQARLKWLLNQATTQRQFGRRMALK
jgi:hypothetical protein